MGMRIEGVNSSSYICDKEGRISLRDAIFSSKNRNFIIKPIAERKNRDYFFFIKIFEKVNNEIKLLTVVEQKLSYENKKIIDGAFYSSSLEINNKIKSLENLELMFWSGGFEDSDMELFYESSFCYPAEVFENKGKKYWEVESFVDSDYLEKLLDNAIKEKYGFLNVFKMLDEGMLNVVKQSKFRFNATKIMETMKEINNGFSKFLLGSIVVQK